MKLTEDEKLKKCKEITEETAKLGKLVVNFINILHAPFSYESKRKMLMKLTQD